MSSNNSFMSYIFERIATEASRLAHYSERSNFTSKEVPTVVRLLLLGELIYHAVIYGYNAVTKDTSSRVVYNK